LGTASALIKEAAGSVETSAAQAFYVVSHPKRQKLFLGDHLANIKLRISQPFYVSVPQAMQFSQVQFLAVSFFLKIISLCAV
jgi:hypothetical protein